MDKEMIFVNPHAGVNRDIPNIGLAYTATHYRTKVIDLNTLPKPGDRYLKLSADVLGISVQSRTFSAAKTIAQNYQARYPQAQIKSVSGRLDVQCCYPYLNFKEQIVYAEEFSDSYPFPDYELFDSFELFRRNWQIGKWGYAIMTSLGCPFSCTYCASRLRPWRVRSAHSCYQELKLAQEKWQIKSFVVIDDCFNADVNRAIEFCRLVGSLGLSWSCSNGLRCDRFNELLAEALSAAGCKNISFGIESADNAVLKAVDKGETVQQMERAVRIARRYFANVSGFFIIGLPSSSYKKDQQSLSWARQHQITPHFSYYLPFDQQMQYDALFYGRGARPRSAAYSRHLQQRIYAQAVWVRKKLSLNRRLKSFFTKESNLEQAGQCPSP